MNSKASLPEWEQKRKELEQEISEMETKSLKIVWVNRRKLAKLVRDLEKQIASKAE